MHMVQRLHAQVGQRDFLVVHLPAKDGEFLFYDDLRFVAHNPHLDEIGNPARFFTDLDVATSPDATTRDIYRPLRTLAFAVAWFAMAAIAWQILAA